jgi:hypothetical protein
MNKKAQLLEAIASQNRGLLSNEIDRVKVLSLLEQLEDRNPTPNPVAAKELLEGNWRLLYTTSKGILGIDRVPIIQLGQVYQAIRTAEAKVYNIAEIVGLPFLEGIVSVVASFEAVSEKRVHVKFERSIAGLQKLLDYKSPNNFIERIEAGKKFFPVDFSIEDRDRAAWIDITYLDENLRVSRGNEGNVFVLSKEN